MVLIEVARFVQSGWLTSALIEPPFHFTYAGFHWVEPLGPGSMNGVMGAMAIAAVGMMFSQWYRLCAFLCSLGAAYIFLIDKTHYLNHMYFLIWVCILFGVVALAYYLLN